MSNGGECKQRLWLQKNNFSKGFSDIRIQLFRSQCVLSTRVVWAHPLCQVLCHTAGIWGWFRHSSSLSAAHSLQLTVQWGRNPYKQMVVIQWNKSYTRQIKRETNCWGGTVRGCMCAGEEFTEEKWATGCCEMHTQLVAMLHFRAQMEAYRAAGFWGQRKVWDSRIVVTKPASYCCC